MTSVCKVRVLGHRQNDMLSKIYSAPETISLNDTIEKHPSSRDNILMLKCIYSKYTAKRQRVCIF